MTIFTNKTFFAVFDILNILITRLFIWLVCIYFLFPIMNKAQEGFGFVIILFSLLISGIEIYRACQYLSNNFLKIDNQKIELQFFKGFAKNIMCSNTMKLA